MHGEERTAHHPSKGWDGDSMTCYISGYHTAPWWEITFKNKHVITGVEMYGKLPPFGVDIYFINNISVIDTHTHYDALSVEVDRLLK